MKWPSAVMWVRHDTSAYNVLGVKKKADELYRKFLEAFKANPASSESRRLAIQVKNKFALGTGDARTPLADVEGRQAYETGRELSGGQTPHVIFVSPYDRARLTLEHITRGWPKLGKVKIYVEDRIREQEHGLALLYNDWRVFHVLHPEQRMLYEREGPYWYRFPQGESVSDVRDRNRDFLGMLIREFSKKRVLVVTHHLNILAMRANMERLEEEGFLYLDEHEKPINCGVTLYRGKPNKGKNGRLELKYYNKKLYS